MTYCETIIASGTANNNTVALTVLSAAAPLTTRTGRGRPKITHAMMLCSTDDVTDGYILPQNCNDQNGIPIPYISKYSATTGFELWRSKLPTPVELPENNQLTIYATSETAAATTVYAWIVLEYPSTGKFLPISGIPVRRDWEHGAALVSNVAARSTDITSLLPGKRYQLGKITAVAVNGATAGIVGPAFLKIMNAEMDGAEYWIPLSNSSLFAAGVGSEGSDLVSAGMKMPQVSGGTPFYTSCVGLTAEQPQAMLHLYTDAIFR